jgi:DNA invertase Pin-like site-specific DNA recombinase
MAAAVRADAHERMRPLRLIGYARVSTSAQGEQGHGLGAQGDELARYAKAQGHELVHVITDVVSGTAADKMTGRAIALAAVEAGIADGLLVRALDRATRDQLDAAELFKRAERNGWRLLDCDRADSGDDSQRLLADIRIAVAAEERRKISQRTREGLARARRAGAQLGRPSRIPPEVIVRIAELNHQGKSAQAIAKQLTAERVPTPGGGTNWAHSTVRAALRRHAQKIKAEEPQRH